MPFELIHEEAIDLTLAAQIFFSFCNLISSFVVGSNPYGGFIAILTALIYGAFTYVSWYGIRQKPSRILYGGIVGACSMLICISLMTAIFWGQYADCETLSEAQARHHSHSNDNNNNHSNHTSRLLLETFSRRLTTGIECKRTSAMSALCAFSVFMFLTYLVFIALILKFKDEILASVPPEDGYNQPGTTGSGADVIGTTPKASTDSYKNNLLFNSMQPTSDSRTGRYFYIIYTQYILHHHNTYICIIFTLYL